MLLRQEGLFRVCYCAGGSGRCEMDGDFRIDMGLLQAAGVQEQQFVCTALLACPTPPPTHGKGARLKAGE